MQANVNYSYHSECKPIINDNNISQNRNLLGFNVTYEFDSNRTEFLAVDRGSTVGDLIAAIQRDTGISRDIIITYNKHQLKNDIPLLVFYLSARREIVHLIVS